MKPVKANGILMQDVIELEACFRPPEQKGSQKVAVDIEASVSPSSWASIDGSMSVTYADGGILAFDGHTESIPNGVKVFPKPGSLVYTRGPWRKRLAYWLKRCWWQLAGKWKRGVENG